MIRLASPLALLVLAGFALAIGGCDSIGESLGSCSTPKGRGQTVIVGDGGTLLTEQGGEWRDASATDVDLGDVAYQNEQVGFAVGKTGVFLRTEDGGETWDAYELGTARLWDVESPDGCTTVLAAGSDRMLMSDDDGERWSSASYRTIDRDGVSTRADWPEDFESFGVAFFDRSRGIALGTVPSFFGFRAVVLLETTNGGSSWAEPTGVQHSVVSEAEVLSAAGDYGVLGAYDTRFGVGTRYTEDQGTTWNTTGRYGGAESSIPIVGLQDVVLQSDGRGVAVGDRGGIYVTTNGWRSWRQAVTDSMPPLYGVDCIGLACMAVGESGAAVLSDNGGTTWERVQTGTTETLRSVVLG